MNVPGPVHSAGNTTQAGDSAGVPWAGRELKPNPFSGDTGEADEQLTAALKAVTKQPFEPEAHRRVLQALGGVRVYAPVLPTAVEHTTDARGLVHDNSSEMAMVRLAAPDGRECTPMFSDIPTLTNWHAQARPVPIETERLAAAAVEEGAQLIIINPGSTTPFLLRRPAMWAWLQDLDWVPAWASAPVSAAVSEVAAGLSWIDSVRVGPGSGQIVSAGPELGLTVVASAQPEPHEFARLQKLLSEHDTIVNEVDSLTLRFVAKN